LRQAAIDRYCRPDSDRFVFLLCTKAGGLGINLVAADTCIIYDSDWNPQNDLQAQARCHRIGQDKMVKIYRLITRNTYEREMFDRASLKLGLDKAVLQSMNTNLNATRPDGSVLPSNALSKKEIEDLLKKGAYGALMDDDNAGDKFCEEDIDSILERRCTTVAVDTEQSGGSFAKATFASADTADIAIDDPDFWAKWAKKAEIEEIDEKTQLMMVEPRSRKKIQRFGGHDHVDGRDGSDSTSDSDEENGDRRGRSKNKRRSSRRGRRGFDDDEDYMEDERDVEYGSWSKSELFRLEKAVLMFG
jgi:chromodomain-helicase-DNA-binding protein 7